MVTTSHNPLLTEYDSLEQAREEFNWEIPEQYNIATDLVSSHADRKGKLALIYEDIDGSVEKFSFHDIDILSNQLANLLADYGVERGDRVAVNLPNVPETALLHMAAYKLGAVVVPLSDLFGPDALEYRLRDSGATVFATKLAGISRQAASEMPRQARASSSSTSAA